MKAKIQALIVATGAALGGLLLSGCGVAPASASSASAPRYELACDASETRKVSALFCVRLDTSTGDVKRIDLSKLRATSGSTMGPERGAGSFQLACESTDTESRSDFHCVRLDRSTGELVVIGLPKVETIAN